MFLIASTLGSLSTLRAQAPIQIVAVSGDLDSNVGSNLSAIINPPVINNAGQVAFDARVDSTSTVLFGDVNGLAHVYRQSSVAPDGDGTLATAFGVSVNDIGQVALRGSLFNSANNVRIFRYDSATGLRSLASVNSPAPGGNGTLSAFEFPDAFDFNNLGQVAFGARLANTTGGSSDDYGIYIGDETGVVEIVREGNLSPGVNEEFVSLQPPIVPSFPLNNNGQVAFVAEVNQIGANNFARTAAIFLSNGSAPATEVARVGDAIGGTSLSIFDFELELEFGVNDQGDVLFSGTTIDGPDILDGFFLANENGVTAIAMEGDAVPNSSDTLERLIEASINEAGQVLFRAALSTANSSGLFLGGVNSPLKSIAQTGEAAPDGNGVFTGFNFGSPQNVALNNNGNVAFAASLNSTDDRTGIFFYGENGLSEIVRTNDPLLGSTITRLRFVGSSAPTFDDQSGLSDFGQVAFSFTLEDGRVGVAIASTGGELLGDVNRNGVVDFNDISPFIGLLSSAAFQFEGDMNEDGNVDFLDIAPFIGALSS